jgi:hypothetical protein
VALVRERIIPTQRPPPVGEISAKYHTIKENYFRKPWSKNGGDSEGYCFQQVDAKWTEIGTQAFLQILLPPS